MPQPDRPTARRVELGHELRLLRRRANLTLEQVVESGAVPNLYFSKLQKVEAGQKDLRSQGDLRALLGLYGVTEEDDVRQMLAIQAEASKQDWWTPYQKSLPSGMPRFIGIESAAHTTHAFHPSLILGLLQTEAYARTLYKNAQPIREMTTEDLESNLQVRIGRQEALTRDENPIELHAVLGEAALRYLIGSPEVMAEQYDQIVSLTERPNVTVQVLPIFPPRIRGHEATHNFSVMHLGRGLPTTVQVDTWSGTMVTDKPREVGLFTREFGKLTASALAPEESVRFIKRLREEIPR